MCGIFGILNYEQRDEIDFIMKQFDKGQSRGPEHSVFRKVGPKITFGFHRLAINGLNVQSNQPLIKDEIVLICNGEIYNYKELYALMFANDPTVIPTTQSDCEVIIWLYERYGIVQTLQMLDGVFAFALLDQRSTTKPIFYLARDPYGVRPLYIMQQNPLNYSWLVEDTETEHMIGFASELKMLADISTKHNCTVTQFQPGTYSKYECRIRPSMNFAEWELVDKNVIYHHTAFANTFDTLTEKNQENVIRGIQKYLVNAVEKRCSTTERPIACLLSGGLDSSLIAALVNDYHRHHKLPPLETYSIGLQHSTDLKYAKMVAEHLGTKHTEIVLTEEDFCEAIPEVIAAIESYDTTTVRASIGNYLIGKYIAANSEAKVIFNGDGSDELIGGYLYMESAPDAIEFDRECRRLLKDIHAFDVLRSDKSISSHGLEPRTPFLDREWTQFYLSVSPFIRYAPEEMEKYLLRYAFSRRQYSTREGTTLLPDDVLWRRKEAFSDGVSGHERSLYQVLQEYCNRKCHIYDLAMLDISNNIPTTTEQLYYRILFESYYPGQGEIVPYFWMPKYIAATDASARTLATYNIEGTP